MQHFFGVTGGYGYGYGGFSQSTVSTSRASAVVFPSLHRSFLSSFLHGKTLTSLILCEKTSIRIRRPSVLCICIVSVVLLKY